MPTSGVIAKVLAIAFHCEGNQTAPRVPRADSIHRQSAPIPAVPRTQVDSTWQVALYDVAKALRAMDVCDDTAYFDRTIARTGSAPDGATPSRGGE